MTIYKGTTWTRTLTVTMAGTATPKDITGAAITFRARRQPTDPDAQISLSVGDGITITDGPNGEAEVTVDGADSALLDTGSYVMAVVVTPSGEDPQVVIPPEKLLVVDMP